MIASNGVIAGSRGWSPKDLPSLAFWGRADNVLLNSGAVETLYDKGTHGRSFGQSTSTKRPGRSTDAAYNNRHVMTFDGDDWLDAGSSWSLSQPGTIYLVGQSGTVANYKTFFDAGSGARWIVRANASHYSSTYAGTANIESTTTVSSPSIVCAVFNGASSSHYINSTTAAVTGNPGTGGLGTPRIGAAPGDVYPLSSGAKMAELIVYNAAHDATTRAKVLRYLNRRYAIAVAGL